MYFRLTQVDIQEGKMEETIAYAESVADSFRDTPGLFQICIAEMDNGQMTSWSLWANEDAMNACLLYTSPSPRDNRTSRMPSSA